MSKITFTTLSINALKPGHKPKEYYEQGRKSGEGSFGIRVSPKGKMTWFALYKNEDGVAKRFTLGTYPDMSLKDARAACADAIAAKRDGTDKQAEKVRKKHAPTMNDLWEAYQNKRSDRIVPKADTTIYEEDRRWNNIIAPALGNLKVEDVTPAMLNKLLQDVVKAAPVSANRLHGLLRVIFKPALAMGWINVHPMQWIEKPGGSEPPRKRILSDDEIKVLWPFFDTVRPNPRDAFKAGLYTAQRPGEILKMRWIDIDLDAGLWKQTENKTDSVQIVPLSPQVIEILQARQDNGSQWVFASAYNTTRHAAKGEGRCKDTKGARYYLWKVSGIADWTAHDLRRTARTIMSRLNIKHHIRERILNHSQGGIVGVYDQHDYLQEKADALVKLANEIDRIRGAKIITSNVVKLHNAGG